MSRSLGDKSELLNCSLIFATSKKIEIHFMSSIIHTRTETHLSDVKYRTNSDPANPLVNNSKLQIQIPRRREFDRDRIQRRKEILRLLAESAFSILDLIKMLAATKIEFQILSLTCGK